MLYLIALGSLVLTGVAVGVLAFIGRSSTLSNDVFNAIAVGQELLGLFLPTVAFLLIDKRAVRTLRLRNPGWGILLTPLIAAVGVVFLSALANIWNGALMAIGLRMPSTNGVILGEGTEGAIISLLVIALTPALFEELLFRGVLLPSFGWMGRMGAVAMSGLLFAMIHGTFSAIPVHLTLGLVLGYLAVASGSLYVPIVYHLSHNAFTVGIMYLYTYLADIYPQFQAALEGGGADPGSMIMTGALMAVMSGLLFAALLYIAWLLFRKRREAFEPVERENALLEPPNWWTFAPYAPAYVIVMLFYLMTFATMLPIN